MKIEASAPAKAILFGEHAVVFGYPAIAVPLPEIRACVQVTETEENSVKIDAPDVALSAYLSDLPQDHPIRFAIDLFHSRNTLPPANHFSVSLTSNIPIASGMGSGAATSTALVKALFQYHNFSFTSEELSTLVYEVEKLHHGTPSGIDNTVTAYEKAVLFRKGKEIQQISFKHSFYLVIADSGLSTPTKETVADVRRLYEINPESTQETLSQIEKVTIEAGQFLINGDYQKAGALMTINHRLLQQLTVSSTQLDKLVSAANEAGAYGAKLSGGGRGGIVIAIVPKDKISEVKDAFTAAGAVGTYHSEIIST